MADTLQGRLAGLVAALLIAPNVAAATDHQVAMRNSSAQGVMVFEPPFTQAKVGDTVTFLPVDMGHNAQLIAGMAPVGVDVAPGEVGRSWTLRLTRPGVYGVECSPHFGLGMVALVQAGAGPAPNLAAAKAAVLPPLAKKRMAPLLAQAR